MIFGQSLSVCGPMIAHPKYSHTLRVYESCDTKSHHSEVICSAEMGTSKGSTDHHCCKEYKQRKTDTSDPTDEEKDCCGDACHCLCCTKVLLNTIPYGSYGSEVLLATSDRPSIMITVHSFDFHPSISNPPQYLHLS